MDYLIVTKHLFSCFIFIELIASYFVVSAMFVEYTRKKITFNKIITVGIILLVIILATLAIRMSL